MKTNPEDSAVTSNGPSARAKYETAEAEIAAGMKRRTEVEQEITKARAGIEATIFAPGNFELSRAMRQGAYVELTYPLEAERIRFQIAITEAEDRKRSAWFELAGELDRDAVQRGDADAKNLATFADDLRALAPRTQEGDFFAIMRVAKDRIASYRRAVAALTARRVAAHEPPPQSLDGHGAWPALVATARARSAGFAITPAEVLRGGRGYAAPDDASISTVDEALDRFLRPQPPRKSTGRLEALRRELAALDAHAYQMREQEQAALAEAEDEKRIRRKEQEAKKEKEARAAEALAKESAKKDAIARERQSKIAEFADSMRRPIAEP